MVEYIALTLLIHLIAHNVLNSELVICQRNLLDLNLASLESLFTSLPSDVSSFRVVHLQSHCDN